MQPFVEDGYPTLVFVLQTRHKLFDQRIVNRFRVAMGEPVSTLVQGIATDAALASFVTH